MMRLQCLDLTRYGKFTGHRIYFGPQETGKPDLHIIYGPNEAGKSTALAAFLDLLFGIEQRSRFNFLHAYSVMRIGGSLEFDGRAHHFARIKRAQNDLLDGNDRPISAGAIAAELGGIDRDAYRSMFSLDDETLEAGGESILASKGDLGQLLFSASTGLADLSRALSGLQAEAAAFYRHHARASELASLKTRLAELKQRRERIDTVASSYAQLVEVRDRAQALYEDAISIRTATQARMDEIQRDLAALPRLARLQMLREQLAPLAQLPAAPAGWREVLRQLQAEEVPLAVQSTRADAAVHQKVQELEAIAIDHVVLAMGTRTDQLADLHARYLTANNDIPDRQLEVRACDLTVASILARIGRANDSNPDRLVFDARTAATFRTLIVRRSGVEAKAEAAAKELAIAKHLLQEAEASIHDGDSPIADKAALVAIATVLEALRSNDHAARLRLAGRARLESFGELRERLAALHPWSGDADQLAQLVCPEPGELQQWKTDLAAAQSRADQLQTEVERLSEERQRLEAERAAITRILGVVSNDNAAAVRAEREAAWLAHRTSLDRKSADVFEAVLRRDDAIVDARLRHETELARLHQTDQSLAVKMVESDQTRQRLDAALAQLQAVRDRVASAVAPLLPGETSIPRLEAWLVRRDKALETRDTLKQAERDVRDAEADAETLRARLSDALRAGSVWHDADAPLDALRSVAEAAVARENEISNLRTVVAQHRREVSARDHDSAVALAADHAWRAKWVDACSGCWLGEVASPLQPAVVEDILQAVSDLSRELAKRQSLNLAIEAMRDGQRSFLQQLSAIAAELDIPDDTTEPLDLWRTIIDRVRQARAAELAHGTASQALREAKALQDSAAETQSIHLGRKKEMTAFFGVGSLAEVAAKLSDIEKRTDLQNQADAATREILEGLRLSSMPEAEARLGRIDRAALEVEFTELTARYTDQDERTRDLFSNHSKAVDQIEAVGGDAEVAKLEEERRTVLLQIEDGAQRYLRLRAGIVAAEHALRAYRNQHRSSMMSHASEAFRTISRNAYSGLSSQPKGDGETLVALAADGGSKIASELSKGTRFQLYLALRVAGYHEFARSRTPVPFIADDIMETFDDHRAEEAFRLLGEMARVGQVIYLTHHQHLCDIAQRICPAARVHDLTQRAPVSDWLPAGQYSN